MHRNDTTGLFLRIGLFAVIALGLVIKSHAQEPTQEPMKTLEHETGFYYTVKEGDTLWDISQHFSDTPWLWPELWKENDQIPNPHWIYPGERIRLFHGMGEHKYLDGPESAASIEQPLEPLQPIQTPLPKSMEPVVTDKYVYYSGMNKVGFIRKEPVQNMGRIFKVRDEKELISTGDTVYIQPQGDTDYIPGSRYTIYRTLSPTKDRKSIQRIGAQYYLLGVLEVTNNETGYAIAKIIDIYREIKIDDKLMPYVNRPLQLPIIKSAAEIEGRIIVSEEHRQIMGENNIAFIDKGAQDNILPGQNYDLYYRMKHSKRANKKVQMELAPIKIGSIVVLHTEKETSTVLIYDSSQSISAGEKFHASSTNP